MLITPLIYAVVWHFQSAFTHIISGDPWNNPAREVLLVPLTTTTKKTGFNDLPEA